MEKNKSFDIIDKILENTLEYYDTLDNDAQIEIFKEFLYFAGYNPMQALKVEQLRYDDDLAAYKLCKLVHININHFATWFYVRNKLV